MTKWLVSCLLIFSILTVSAQQIKHLTLDEAVKLGLDNSKQLKISQAKVGVANARYSEAVDAALPSLRLSAGYQRLSDLTAPTIQFPGFAEPIVLFPIYVNNYTSRLSLNETVFSGFRLKYAMESQQFLQKATGLDAERDKDEVVFNIIQAYYNLYKIKESQKIVNDNLEQVTQHVKETELHEKQGMATHNDVLRWELQQSNIELTKLDLENNFSIANYNAELMLGLNDVTLEPDSSTINTIAEQKAVSDYMKDAADKRSDLLSQDLRMKSAANNLKIAKNSYSPQVAVGGNLYDSRPNPRVIPPKDEFTFTWDVGITLSWDLVSLYSNKHNVAEANAILEQNKQAKDLLTDAVKMEVNQNYLSYREAIQRVSVIQKSVTQAEENYRITDSRYRNNLVLLSDLLDANTILLQAKLNLALSKADQDVAYYKLLKSTGNGTK